MSISLYHKDDSFSLTPSASRGKLTRFLAKESIYIIMVLLVLVLVLPYYLTTDSSKTAESYQESNTITIFDIEESPALTTVAIFFVVLCIISLVLLLRFGIYRYEGFEILSQEERNPISWNLWCTC